MNENENNVIETEVVTTEDDTQETRSSGMGTGLAMLIGGGITLAVIAGAKKLKKIHDKRKLQKEAKEEIEVIDLEDEEVD